MAASNISLRNIIIAYLISVPIFLGAIILVGYLVSGEALALIILIDMFGYGIIGLLVSFTLSIWYASALAHNSLLKGKGLLQAADKFSLTVNLIGWSSFLFITFIQNLNHNFLFAFLIVVACFAIALLFTTFTIGLLVSYQIRRNLRKHNLL